MRFLIFFLFLLSSTVGITQTSYPTNQWFGSASTLTEFRGAAKAVHGFVNAVYADTATANLAPGYLKFYPGAQIMAGDSMYFRNLAATAWLLMNGSGGGGGGGTWGTITGTLSNQTDLQTALNLKANLASPTFTGTVTMPTPFTLGAVSVLPTGTELNFVDGVTSNIQTQLDLKAPLISPLFTTPRLASTSTISYVWTATDGNGNGSFQAASGGGSGITELGNGFGLLKLNDSTYAVDTADTDLQDWARGNLIVEPIGSIGIYVVVPRNDSLLHRPITAGANISVDTLPTGEIEISASSGGSGTVSTGVAGALAYYASAGTTVDDIIGTANQIAGMNSGATAPEFKTLAVGAAGTDPNIVHTANTITWNFPLAGASVTAGLISNTTKTIAGTTTFSGAVNTTNLTVTGVFSQNASGPNSILYMPTAVASGTATTAALLFDGASTVRARAFSNGSTAMAMAANESGANWVFAASVTTEAASGTHAGIYGIQVLGPVINNGAGATTEAATFNIDGPPTGTAGIANRVSALRVRSGVSKFGGVLNLPAYTVGTLPAGVVGDIAYVTDATAPTYLGALTGGGAVVCPVFYNGAAWVSH